MSINTCYTRLLTSYYLLTDMLDSSTLPNISDVKSESLDLISFEFLILTKRFDNDNFSSFVNCDISLSLYKY